MGSQELAEFKAMTILSALATEAVCLWDDIAEKLEDDPTLRATLGVTEQELADITGFIRRVQDGAHDHRNDLQRALEAALSAPCRRRFGASLWTKCGKRPRPLTPIYQEKRRAFSCLLAQENKMKLRRPGQRRTSATKPAAVISSSSGSRGGKRFGVSGEMQRNARFL